jgi:aminopeptidase N
MRFLQVAVKTLPFYKKYFNIAYPLPKMDLIAVADFAAGMITHLDSKYCYTG